MRKWKKNSQMRYYSQNSKIGKKIINFLKISNFCIISRYCFNISAYPGYASFSTLVAGLVFSFDLITLILYHNRGLSEYDAFEDEPEEDVHRKSRLHKTRDAVFSLINYFLDELHIILKRMNL